MVKHEQWTCDESFFQNIPNVLTDWADGPNELWGIWGTFHDVLSVYFFAIVSPYTANVYRVLRGLCRDSLLWGNTVIFTDCGEIL